MYVCSIASGSSFSIREGGRFLFTNASLPLLHTHALTLSHTPPALDTNEPGVFNKDRLDA